MSFCTSLRRRRSCANLLSPIQAEPLKLFGTTLGLPLLYVHTDARNAENDLKTHDLHIKIRVPSPDGPRNPILRFLILTPSCVTDSRIQETLARITRFSGLSGGKCCALIFHLSAVTSKKDDTSDTFPTPLHALSALQIHLHKTRLNLPVLPLSDPAALSTILTTFARPFTQPRTPGPKLPNAAMDVLPSCTTNAPMSRETLVKVTDVVGCLKEVASPGEADVGKLIEGGLKIEDVEAMLGFWEEEWVVE